MGRTFARASAHTVQFNTSGQPFRNWGFGTLAAWIRKATDSNTMMILCNDNAGSTDEGFAFYINSSNQVELWSDTAGATRTSTSFVQPSDGWCLVGVSKATGGTPRFHIHKQPAGTWAHENGAGTLADNTAVDNTDPLNIGRDFTGGSGHFDGDIAAVLAIPGRAMSDGEFERLAGGHWDQQIQRVEDLLVEFPSGRDPYISGGATIRANDIGRMRNTATTGTTRTAFRDPVGMRFSRHTRRR